MNVNLEIIFDYYNQKLFNNELPKIPVKFSDDIDCAGICHCDFFMKKMHPKLNLLQNYYVPNTLLIEISSKYKDNYQRIEAILLHEMTHAWFYSYDKPKIGHGKKFRKKIRKLSAKAGFKIPYRYIEEMA